MIDEKINSTANNIQINIDNLSYVDYLWTQRTSDTAIQGIRLDQRNLPLNLNADTVDNKHASDFALASHTHNYAGSSSAGGAANSVKGALTFGSKAYNGSTAQTITASDLGALTAHQDISGKVNKTGDSMSGNLNPSTNKGASLGTSSLQWNNIYGTTIYENGTALSNKYASKTNLQEAYLTWGGKNFSGSYGPIDAAMVAALGANRLAFATAAGIQVEYSRDAGATWTDYGLTDTQKTAIFSGPQTNTAVIIGKPGSKDTTTGTYLNASINNRARITITSNAANVYTALNKFVIYCSTSGSGGCKCIIEGQTKANYDANNNTWTTFADSVDISGWSGFNVINTSSITTYGNTSAQYIKLRFTFYCTSVGSMAKYGGLQITNIYGFGGVGWVTPSNMAKWGQIYTYDASQNVTFPATVNTGTINSANIYPRTSSNNLGSNANKWANVYATAFHENGTSLVNKYAGISHTHNYAASDTSGGPANSVKNNLTIGGVIYNGSTAVNIPYGSDVMAISSTTSTPGTISQLSRADHIHKIDLATGDANGQVKIAGTNVDVKGLGSAAYTNSSDYATPDWTKEHWAKEISTQDVRIWGLDQGIYKLTYGMDSTTPKDHIVNIYYNGETGTEKKSISPTPLYLYVDAVNATAATRLTSWRLYVHSGTIFKGRTNSRSGTIEQGWAISYITKLNGATTANTIYAPTTSGTSGQILQSNGDGAAPTWINVQDAELIQFTDNKVLINDGGTLSGRLYLKITSGNANGSISNADKTALYDISCKGIGNVIALYTPNGDTIEITTNAQTGVLYDTGIDLDLASGWYLNGLTDLEVYGDKIISLNLQDSFDRVNGVATSAINDITWDENTGRLAFEDWSGTAKSTVTLPIKHYFGTTYGECYTIDAPNLEYSMQIGTSGFTVDSEIPGYDHASNILQVNPTTFTYMGHNVLHNGNATKMASFYSHSGSKYVDIRTNQGSSTTNGVVIIATGTISLAGETTISLTHSMPNTNYALFFTQVNSSTNATTTYVPIIRSKNTGNFKVFIGSGGVIYNYLAVYVG